MTFIAMGLITPVCAIDLVELTTIIPTIKIDLIYATDRNFTGKKIYTNPRCMLLKNVADKLACVQHELSKMGLGLLIWDAYRPLQAQKKLWEICPDSRYVCPPEKGGKHTRGTTVDLTLIRLIDGMQLEMPTGFDDFSPKAAADYADVSPAAKKNRALLQQIMCKYGFTIFRTEWWHFDIKDWQQYPVLDIDF